MPLNTLGLVAGIAVARREGVDPSQVARVALPGAIFPNLAIGVIMVDRLAKQEASAEAVASAGAVTTVGGGGTTVSGGGTTVGGGGTTGGGGVITDDTVKAEPTIYPGVTIAPQEKRYKSGDTVIVEPGRWLNLADPATPPHLSFQWFRADPKADPKRKSKDRDEISGATSRQYEITDGDAGKVLTVDVTYIDHKSGGARVTTTSPPITVADETKS